MIRQDTPTSRRPVTSAILPVQYAEAGMINVAAWEAEFARIPQAIRDEFCGWQVDENGSLVRFGYRFGSPEWLTSGEGYWPSFSAAYAGVYGSAKPIDVRFTSRRAALTGTYAIVHEFGHHIDQTFRLVRGLDLAPHPNTALRYHAPFSTTWQTVRSSIPSALYGATSILEWIAEQWRCQIQGDGTMFLQLMGGSRTVADTIRAEWVSMFPSMPTFTY